MKTKIDHIVIGAANLEQGAEYVKDLFGVEMPKGGEHPLMATHNLLMRLGGDVFIEVISMNPDAPVPARPRWYGLDDPQIFQSLKRSPKLLTWVVNSNNISALLHHSKFEFGTATPVTRGNLNWNFAIPDDGRLLAGGVLPYVMQWHVSPHPAAQMPDCQCRLKSIEITHPYSEWVSDILDAISIGDQVKIFPADKDQGPELKVEIATPDSTIVLSNIN